MALPACLSAKPQRRDENKTSQRNPVNSVSVFDEFSRNIG
jgi:hypothetical protein